MKLCTYSRSERHSDSILQSCPLLLNRSQSSECPCRENVYRIDAYTFRVTACRQPATWYGGYLSSPEQAQLFITKASKSMTSESDQKSDQSLKPLWEGIDIPIIGVTGPKASGKTLFASTIDPQHTLMIDCEMSSSSYSSIPYAQRLDLFEELASRKMEPTPENAWIIVKEAIEKADPNKIRVVVIDPWDFIQGGYVASIERTPERFGHTRNQYEKASGLLWGDVSSSLHMWLGMQAKRLKGSIVLINHLGFVWKDNKPTEKTKAKGVGVIYQLASLYIRMDRSPDNNGKVPEAPAGFVTEVLGGKSRLVHTEINSDGAIELKPVLPPRMPVCTPAAIRQYIKTPPDYAKLKKGELAPAELMTSEQKLEIKAQMASDIKEAEVAKLSRLEMMRAAGASRTATQQAKPATGQVTLTATVSPQPVATTVVTAEKTTEPEAKKPDEQPPFEGGSVASEAIQKAKDAGKEAKCSGLERVSCPHPVDTVLAKSWLFGFDACTVQDIVEWQRKKLGIKDDAWLTVLQKDNVATTHELPVARAEEIRKKFWDRLTKADAGKA